MKKTCSLDLSTLDQLDLTARQEEIVHWQGRDCLRLNGLAILPCPALEEGRIEVEIGAEGAAYPGVAFRIKDTLNYELAYAQPHTSGKWDALQYDPVFHGSNTWQMYHGAGFQQTADVSQGRWFTLAVDFKQDQALVQLDQQPPLAIPRLAHEIRRGRLGLWTYQPAYFSTVRVMPLAHLPARLPESSPAPVCEECPEAWFVKGFGSAACEPHGVLNLNRYLPAAMGKAELVRSFDLAESGSVQFEVGYSDHCILEIDGREIHRGEHRFHPSPDWDQRGYVNAQHAFSLPLEAGRHRIDVQLSVSEPFGWGLFLKAGSAWLRWLPVELEN